MPPSLSELKVLPSFCFAFKIPDDVAASNNYMFLTKIKIFNVKPKLGMILKSGDQKMSMILFFYKFNILSMKSKFGMFQLNL